MKYISLTLAALFCASSPLVANEEVQTRNTEEAQSSQETNFSFNNDFVTSVRSQYAEGKYQEFLTQMDEDYKDAQKEGLLEGLISIRKEDALISAEQNETAKEWDKMAKSWAEERNKELLKLINSNDTSLLAKKIHAITQPLDPIVEETLNYFFQLRNLEPGDGKNADENYLIDRDLELEYKQIHFDSSTAAERWIPDHQEKRLALRLEMMDKMMADSQKFEDKDLQKKVQILSQFFDTFYTKQMDLRDLHLLATGMIAPTSDLEKKAAEILASFEGKFSELTRQILQQPSEETNQ